MQYMADRSIFMNVFMSLNHTENVTVLNHLQKNGFLALPRTFEARSEFVDGK